MEQEKERNSFIVVNGRFLTPEGFRSGLAMVVENGKIAELIPRSGLNSNPSLPIYDAGGMDVVPGFFDIHVHGGSGSDFMDATAEDIETVLSYHAHGGATSLLATTASARFDQIIETLRAIDECMTSDLNGARIMGVHLEGPYFNFVKKGCHLPSTIRNPEPREYSEIMDFCHIISRMTLAPEIPGADELMGTLRRQNILVSVGHSAATFDTVEKVLREGRTHATHMYCAMSDVIKMGVKRTGGIVQATLFFDDITTEIIADGKHLPPELLKLTVKIKSADRVALCTDAMRGAGMPEGIYAFGPRDGNPAKVRNGEAVTMDESGYSSSVVQMIDLVRVITSDAGVPVEQAIAMASSVPAKIMGVDDKIGSLEKGKYADFLILSRDLSIKEVWKSGKNIVTS